MRDAQEQEHNAISKQIPEQRDTLYEVMKGRAYGAAEIATGCTNAEAIQRGYSDMYELPVSKG